MRKSFSKTWLGVTNFFVHIAAAIEAGWRRVFGPKTVHKSLRLTRRRDALRPLIITGYFAFTSEVFRIIWVNKKTLLGLALVYLILYGVLVGVSSQETYATLSDLLRDSTKDALAGVSGALYQSGVLFLSIAASGLSEAPTEVQQVLAVVLFAMLWLSTVWLVRSILAGKKVRMRDGIYSSGSPLFATIVVIVLILLQLIPVGLAFIGYAAASTTGMLEGGVEAMLFWLAAGLLGLLSLYWVLSSVFALVLITIPGTYPVKAMQVSSRMIAGRRTGLLLRIIWMGVALMLTWVAVLIPAILIDAGLKQLLPAIAWLPIVPVVVLGLAVWSALWGCVYMYLLYRRVVDSESA